MPPKKNSIKEEKPSMKINNLSRDLLHTMFGKWDQNRHLRDQVGPGPGPTKSWLKQASSKKPCIYMYKKQPQYPQLTDQLINNSTINYGCDDYGVVASHANRQWSLTGEGDKSVLIVWTKVSNVEPIRYYNRQESRLLKHEITRIDRYDSENRVMQFTNVVECDGKFYALSLQGSLVVMEEKGKARLTITGICRTRVVPSCYEEAKYFDEYLIESRGNVFLVFLIYREKLGVVDDVEVYRTGFDDGLELVKVGGLGGRALFLEKKYHMWVDSREIGCKGDCVYFFAGDNRWRMYDLETKSISMDEPGV